MTLSGLVASCNRQRVALDHIVVNTDQPIPAAAFARSPCPVAITLDTLGDRWSLVIVRDLFRGRRRFSEFLESPEGIKRNILAERLKRLEAAGLISRRAYQQHPPRFEYRLTRAGADLLPILQAIMRWAVAHRPQAWVPPQAFFEARPEQFYEADAAPSPNTAAKG